LTGSPPGAAARRPARAGQAAVGVQRAVGREHARPAVRAR